MTVCWHSFGRISLAGLKAPLKNLDCNQDVEFVAGNRKGFECRLYTYCSSPYCSQRTHVITLFLQVHVPLSIAEVAGFLRLQGASLGQHVCKKEDMHYYYHFLFVTETDHQTDHYYKDQFL